MRKRLLCKKKLCGWVLFARGPPLGQESFFLKKGGAALAQEGVFVRGGAIDIAPFCAEAAPNWLCRWSAAVC